MAAVAVAAEKDGRTGPLPGPHAQPAFAQAQWIAPPAGAGQPLPLFRKEFSLEAQPRKATLRIVGLGDYDARVNGQRLADTGINQPWSQYEKTIYYRDFDITPLVQPGANCVGVMLFNSFWHNPNPPAGPLQQGRPAARGERAAAAVRGGDRWSRTTARSAASARTPPGGRPRARSCSRTSSPARISTPAASSRAGTAPGSTTATWQPARAARRPTASLDAPALAAFPGSRTLLAAVRQGAGAGRLPVQLPAELLGAVASRTGGRQARRPHQLPLRRAQERPGPAVRRLHRRLRTGQRRPAARCISGFRSTWACSSWKSPAPSRRATPIPRGFRSSARWNWSTCARPCPRPARSHAPANCSTARTG